MTYKANDIITIRTINDEPFFARIINIHDKEIIYTTLLSNDKYFIEKRDGEYFIPDNSYPVNISISNLDKVNKWYEMFIIPVMTKFRDHETRYGIVKSYVITKDVYSINCICPFTKRNWSAHINNSESVVQKISVQHLHESYVTRSKLKIDKLNKEIYTIDASKASLYEQIRKLNSNIDYANKFIKVVI